MKKLADSIFGESFRTLRSNRYKAHTALTLVMGVGAGATLTSDANAQLAPDALPTGGDIVHGQAKISQAASAMRIEQHSAQLIANWDTFSIGKDASVDFVQPDANSIALNRVLGSRASEIMGRLTSNGKVMLVNPAGIIVGKDGQVNVGALTASTLNIADADLLDGKGVYAFKGNSTAAVRNFGKITVPDGGLVALIAPVLENRGTITTPGGATYLASGSDIELNLGGEGLVSLRVNKGAVDSAIVNGGIISANGGMVVLTAKGVDDLSRAAINLEGIVEAKGITRDGGRIMLGDASANVTVSGKVDASSDTGKGGSVKVEGKTIALTDTARFDATGDTGGGTVLVGGSWQNSDKSVAQAQKVTIASGALLDASARTNGNGGMVVAWSDVHDAKGLTDVRGTLLAKGGLLSGDGGKIETSGYDLKVDGIRISTLATKGKTGEWLLDPYNITIAAAGTAITGNYTPTADSAIISAASVQTALNTSNVTISTGLAGSAGTQAGTITVDSAITSDSLFNLELKAASTITLNADITRSGTGGLILRSDAGVVNGTGKLVLGGGTKLSLAHGTTMSNNISIADGGATIDFAPLEIEYLIVGGGGASLDAGRSGGGGGGGFVTSTGLLTQGQTYAVTVGAGGAIGASGQASSIVGAGFNQSAAGGGTGSGGAGASGGGASAYAGGLAGTAIAGQGFGGGLGSGNLTAAGGGGGAGGLGQAGVGTSTVGTGGAGGAGKSSTITGRLQWYAGGGGGFSSKTDGLATASCGAGGIGGGGRGSDGDTPAVAGTPNTGGGGGGGYGDANPPTGAPDFRQVGTGGSGVVVVRYVGPDATSAAGEVDFTGTGDIGVLGTKYQIRQFNDTGTFAVDNMSALLTGEISGTPNLTVNATGGAITLAADNPYSGNATIAGGAVKLTNTNALSKASVSLANVAGAQLQLINADANPAANPLIFSVAGLSGGGTAGGDVIANNGTTFKLTNNVDGAFAGTLSGGGLFEKWGTGTQTLSGNVTIGGINIAAGTVTTGATGGFGNIDSLGRYAYAGPITVNANAIFTFATSNTQFVTGSLSGAGTIKLPSTGNLRVTNDNAGFSGTFAATNGTLSAYHNNAFGNGKLELGGGATLSLAHGVTLANNITLTTGGATIDFAPLEVEYLIVGGGGSGTDGYGGGGGAGGFLTGSTTLSDATFDVVVGAGGARSDLTAAGSGNKGGNSSAFGLTAIGGGAAGSYGTGVPTVGGSGGGAGGINGLAGAAGTAGQGNKGGSGYNTTNGVSGGGGGGAGTAGGNATISGGGAGGDGKASSITGTVKYYAAGGGGAGYKSTAGVVGGAGGRGGGGGGASTDIPGAGGEGGGQAGTENNGGNAAANTGSGGGGGQSTGNTFTVGSGGAGGSGVVIVRYLGADVGTGGDLSTFKADGTNGLNGATYQVRTFNSSGTLTVNRNIGLTGAISGASNLTIKAGTGTVTLGGTGSTYTGTANVATGVLKLTSATGLGNQATVDLANVAGVQLQLVNANADPVANPLIASLGGLKGGGTTGGEVVVNSNTTLQLGSTNVATTYAGALSGAGLFEKVGTGTLTLSGRVTSDFIKVSEGTLTTSATGGLGDTDSLGRYNYAGQITLDAAGIFAVATSATQFLRGNVTGAGKLSQTGTGNLRLFNTNSGFSGTASITKGALLVYNGNTFGTAKIELGGGAKLSLAHGTTLPNNIDVITGGGTIDFAPLEIEYLIVAGGGGGGGGVNASHFGGGGGAGELVTGFTTLAAGSNSTLTIGAGGAGGVGNARGATGADTTAFGVVAKGGGGGGASTIDGVAGGSGGGGAAKGAGGLGGATTATANVGQGNVGGTGTGAASGGGGGAGGAGFSGADATNKSKGGAGLASSITGTSKVYATGGDGGSSTLLTGVIGAANTGSGGSGVGATAAATSNTGGKGGSGVVIARYIGPSTTTGGDIGEFDGNGTNGGAAGTKYQIRTFTANGALQVDNNFVASLTGKIGGAGNLTVDAGVGSVTVAGTGSTYTGTATISKGVLKLASATGLGNQATVDLANVAGVQLHLVNANANPVTNPLIVSLGGLKGGGTTGGEVIINSNATLQLGNAADASFAGALSGVGVLEKVGTGTQTLAGKVTTDLITVSAGTLATSATGGFGIDDGFGRFNYSGTLTLGAAGTFATTTAADQILSGAITGAGTVSHTGTGALKLAGNGTGWTGAAKVTSGTLGIYRNTAMGSAKLSIGGANLKLGRTVTSLTNDIELTGATSLLFDTTVDYLVVGGGGAGGAVGGGGGGAGGFVTGTTSVANGATAVAVGAGGALSTATADASNGTQSKFGSIIALGGGGGGASGSGAGADGASGGGGSRAGTTGTVNTLGAAGGAATQPGSTSGGFGFAGGAGKGFDGNNMRGGGGGGAGGAGQGAPDGTLAGGAGGAGLSSSITGTAAVYAGGGGGGSGITAGGAGGAGGGGAGSVGNNVGYNALANTGSGGGGGGAIAGGGGAGGAGGSGIVVVRYLGGDAGAGGGEDIGLGTAKGYYLHTFSTAGDSTLTLDTLAATLAGKITGAGNLSVDASSGDITFGGTGSTYSGTANIAKGVVKLASASGLGDQAIVSLANVAGVQLQIVNTNANPATNPLIASLGKLTGGGASGGSVVINSNSTLQVGNAVDATFAGALSGAGQFEKVGTGTVTLSGNVTAAQIKVSAGKLTTGTTTGFGDVDGSGRYTYSGSIAVGSAGTMAFATSATQFLTGNLSGAGLLEKAGTGTLSLSGEVTTDFIKVSSGVLTTSATGGFGKVDASGRYGYDGTITISAAGALEYATAATQFLTGSLSGAGKLNMTNTGNLRLLSANSGYTGTVSATKGILSVYNDGSLGGGKLELGGGAKLRLAHGVTFANDIALTSGGATIDFTPLEVEYLIVGGGGSGTDGYGGGGGAGGFVTGNTVLTDASYSVVVGAGGARSYFTAGGSGNMGDASSAFGVVAAGGGAGGSYNGGRPTSGGSGGGAGATDVLGGAHGIAGQGSQGGAGFNIPEVASAGGGGGGAGGVGGNGTVAGGGAGGAGRSSNITGVTKFYAAGGGGSGSGFAVAGGAGGIGGGGGGASAISPGMGGMDGGLPGLAMDGGDGAANTGSGGGGAQSKSDAFSGGIGGAGGSGVVIARYIGANATAGGIETNFVGDGSNGIKGATYQVAAFNSSGTLALDSFAAALTGKISGAENLSVDARGGTVTIGGKDNTFTGTASIASGALALTSATGLGSQSTIDLANVAGVQLQIVNANANPAADPLIVALKALNGGGAIGGEVVINSNATLQLGGDNLDATYAGALSGAGIFQKIGTGTLTLSGKVSTDFITVTAGTLATPTTGGMGVDDGLGRLNYTGSLLLETDGTFAGASSGEHILSGKISGAGKLIQSGTGALKLAGDNGNFTGTVTATSGTLGLYRNTALGSAKLSIGGATLKLGRSVTSLANEINLTGATSLSFDTDVDYLVVGGGGGGATPSTLAGGGGGGGGSVRVGSVNLTNASTAITVGTGGTANVAGGNSSFGATFTATGGNSGAITNGGTGTASVINGVSQTYVGGTGITTVFRRAGGGGSGAGGSGTSATATTDSDAKGGTGGNGVTTAFTGFAIAYGGGGGGGSEITAGLGGLGGGGNGGQDSGIAATAGANGLGGGGGGGGLTNVGDNVAGAVGGSGVVVVRYLGGDAGAGGAETAGAGVATGYNLHTFTSTGSSNLTLNTLAATLAGKITGAGNLSVDAGTGKVALTGANDYTGTTTITGGTLGIGSGATAGVLGTGAIVNNAALEFNRSNDLTVANVISGTGRVMQAGTGTLILSNTNTYSGGTSINNGTLLVSAAGQIGTTGAISFGGGVFKFGTNYTADISARFATTAGQKYRLDTNNQAITLSTALSSTGGTLEKLGSGTLTLTGGNTYSGATTITAGELVLENDAPSVLTGRISGPGALTIRSSGGSFSSALDITNWSFGSDLASLTIGKVGNTASVKTGAINIEAPVSIIAGDITIGGALKTTGALNLTSSGSVTQTAAIDVATLKLAGSGSFALTNVGNVIDDVSAGTSTNRIGALSLTNSNALALTNTGGIYSSDDVLVQTVTGNLTLGTTIDTTSASKTALRLAAGTSASAGGDGAGASGNVIVSGTPVLTAGTNGVIALYSGNIADSTGLVDLAGGSGSGQFRYNSTLNAAGYTAELSANKIHAIFRQKPVIAATSITSQTITYGDTLAAFKLTDETGVLNGDAYTPTIDQAVYSSANKIKVGTYTVKVADALSKLGYDTSAVTDGSLTVNKRALTVSGITALDKIYDGSDVAQTDVTGAQFVGLVAKDVFAVAAEGRFDSKNVGVNKVVTLKSSYSGADVGNYAITDQGPVTATITKRALTVSGITALDKIYDGSDVAQTDVTGAQFAGLVANDVFAVAAEGMFDSKNVGVNKVVTLKSTYSGADVGNYAITDQRYTLASIAKRALTVSGITAADKIYDGNTVASVDVSGAQYAGLVANDVFAVSATGLFDSKNVGTGKVVTLTSSYGGADVGNYAITAQATTTATVAKRMLTVGGLTALNKVYDGNSDIAIDTKGAIYAGLVAGDDLRAVATGTTEDKNVAANKSVSIMSEYVGRDVQNYTIIDQLTGSASITRKNSVAWVGGATGNWFDANNWAGGAVPDLANVAEVVIGNGVTVQFAGGYSPVELEAVRQSGTLDMVDGSLAVGRGGIALAGLQQSGGVITVGGAATLGSVIQSGGSFQSAGNLTVNFDFDQGPSGTLQTLGSLSITDNTGGMRLGALTANGQVRLTSAGGAITQQAVTSVAFGGPLTLSATNAAIVLDAAENALGSSVLITNAGQVNLTTNAAMKLNISNATGPVAASAAGDINATVNVKDQLTLVTTNAGNIFLEGFMNKLTMESDGAILFGKTRIAKELDIESQGDILETAPWAVAVGAQATGKSASGKIDVRALIDGQALNSTLRPVNEVKSASSSDAGQAGKDLAISRIRDAAAPETLILGTNLIVDQPLAAPSATSTVALSAGQTVAAVSGTTISVRFSEAEPTAAPTAKPEAGSRTLPVFVAGQDGSAKSFVLKVRESAGAYTVEAENTDAAPAAAAAPDVSVDLTDPLDLVVESAGGIPAKLAVGVENGALVMIADNPASQKVVQEKGPAVVALALAELRKARDIKADSISGVMVVEKK